MVVAGSNGCSAALRLALEAPELVAGLVLAWPVVRQDRWFRTGFERSAAFVASAGTSAYLEELGRRGVPGNGEERPGLAFGVALLRDERARASWLRLSGGEAAALLRRSVRGCSAARPSAA